MKSNSKTKQQSSFPILITDILVFALLGIICGFLSICTFKRANPQILSDGLILGIGVTTGIFLLSGLLLYLLIEYKYNRLKLKNIFLLLGIAIAINNLIAVVTLPSQMTLPNDSMLIITPSARVYYIFSGLFYSMLPYLFFYLIPRKITSRHYLDIMLYILLGFILLTIPLSFITDWRSYINFFNDPTPVGSIFFQKGTFALLLLIGMYISVFLRIRHHNIKWSLLLIPLYIFLIFSLSKITLLVGTLFVLIYVIIELVLFCKKSKDNLVITLSIVTFLLLLSPLFIMGLARSETGIFAKIREEFLNLVNNAQDTLNSRILIWESTFKLLSSYRIIFGYGVASFDLALHQVYNVIAPPFDVGKIYSSHNFVVELLGNGGIVLLGIYTFIYAYYIRAIIKIRKNNRWLSIMSISFLVLFSLIGMFDNERLCGEGVDFMVSLAIISPIMFEYFLTYNKDEIAMKNYIVKSSRTIKTVNIKSKILKINKKRLIYDAKYIAYDLNSKIRL